jgi:hypothetical protein
MHAELLDAILPDGEYPIDARHCRSLIENRKCSHVIARYDLYR